AGGRAHRRPGPQVGAGDPRPARPAEPRVQEDHRHGDARPARRRARPPRAPPRQGRPVQLGGAVGFKIAFAVLIVGVVLGLLWLVPWLIGYGLRRLLARAPASMPIYVAFGLTRNWIRTLLTVLSVTAALFLFVSLGGVLDTLRGAIQVGSEQRLVTRNAI